MPSVPYTEAALLSFCSVVPPRFDSLVTDQVLARLPIRTLGTQCEKRAVVTDADKPAIVYIGSGGTLNDTAVTWDAPGVLDSLRQKRIGTWIQINGDIKDNLSQAASIVNAQARLFRQMKGEASFREDPNTPKYVSPDAFPQRPPNEQDFAWIQSSALPAGMPYSGFPYTPVPMPDFLSGAWLAPGYQPSVPLPHGFESVKYIPVAPPSGPLKPK